MDGEWVKKMLGDIGVDVSRVGVLETEVRLHTSASDSHTENVGHGSGAYTACGRWRELYW